MVATVGYIPERGDLVWLDFDPQLGREQAGRRPALVLSPAKYNQRVGLFVICPVTRQAKGYPFEVALGVGAPVEGVVLSDHVKNLDWTRRRVEFIGKAASLVVAAVAGNVNKLIVGQIAA